MEEESRHELQVCFSDRIFYHSVREDDDIERVIDKLRRHCCVGKPQFYLRKSATPPPEFISILGDVAPWAAFALAAKYFLKAFLTELGSASGKKIVSLLSRKEAEPLSDLMSSIDEIAHITEGRLQVIIGLNIPDDQFGTSMRLEYDDPNLTVMVALFIDNANKIKQIIVSEMNEENSPLGGAIISFQDDGNMKIIWRRRSDGRKIEVTIEPMKY